MKLREFQFIYPWAHKPRSQGTFTPVPFSSVSQLCLTLCYAMDCNMPGFLSIINSQSLLKLMSIKSVMAAKYLILCHSLLILPSVFPSITSLSNESVLCIRWPKHWRFNLSISPSNEYSGLISVRIRASQEVSTTHSSKTSILQHSAFFVVQLSHPYMTTG